MAQSASQYFPGRAARPSEDAKGEKGSHSPIALTTSVVMVSGRLAQLCKKGIFPVLRIWMMRVCESRDSTNQPLWKSAGLSHASKT